MYVTGRLPLLLLAGVVPAWLLAAQGVAWWWLLLAVLAVVVDVAAAPRPDRFGVHREPVPRVRCGEPSTSTLVLGNPRRGRTRVQVRDAWAPSAGAGVDGRVDRHWLRLPGGGRGRAVTDLLPSRRGELRAQGVTLRCPGPLGVAGRQRTLDVPGALRVLPAFPSRKHLPSRLAVLRELDGRSAVRVRGPGTEFDSLREYVAGDDVRSIDWRASARSRNVVVRTWQPERDRRVVLVLDTSRVSAARIGDAPRLDTSMDASMLLTALAARAGDRIDLVAGDRVLRGRLRMHGSGALAELQEQLTTLTPEFAEADWRMLAGAVQQGGRQRALVVLLTALDPASVAESLLPALPALVKHHRVVVAAVRDPELAAMTTAFTDTGSVDDVYAATAALQAEAEAHAVVGMLQALGVEVVSGTPDTMPVALADHYLALKARGLL